MGRRVVGGLLVAGVLVGLLVYVLGSRPKRAISPDLTPVATPSLRQSSTPAGRGRVMPSWLVRADLPEQKVAGRVVRDGNPVPDAFVGLKMSDAPDVFGDSLLRSDAEGRFDFGAQPAARFVLVAWAPGTPPATRHLDLVRPTDRSAAPELEVVLSACQNTAFGRVRDAEGTPLAKARVRVAEGQSVETGDDGRFEICFGVGIVVVSADGYGTVSTTAYPSPLDVILVPEAGINGVVLSPDGTAAPGVIVSVWPDMGYGRETSVTIAADEAGRFQVRGLNGGTYRARAVGEGMVLRNEVQSFVEPGTFVDVTLRLAPASTLRGVALVGDAPASVRFSVSSPRTQWSVATTSAGDGSFVVGPVPLEYVTFFPYNGGSASIPDPPGFLPTRAVHEHLTLRFPPAGAIRGRVLRDGRPAAGATVACGLVSVPAEASGQYVCEQIAPQDTHVVASLGRKHSAPVKVTVTAGEVKDVDLALLPSTPGASVSGVVVDAQGEPVVDATVQLIDRQTYGASTGTNPRGEFTIEQIPLGNFSITVLAEDRRTQYSAASGSAFPLIEVRDGSDVKGVRLVVPRLHLRTIEGTVIDASGAAVRDARIQIAFQHPGVDSYWGNDHALPAAISDRDGRFLIDRVSEGTYAILAATPSSIGTIRDVRAGARGVVIALRAAASIEGRLVGFGAVPRVVGRSRGGAYRIAEILGDTFRFPRLATGRYMVAADGEDGAAVAEVDVAPESVARLTLVGHGVGKVVVRIVDTRSRQPIAGVPCGAVLRAGQWSYPVGEGDGTSDERGEVRLDRVAAGDLIVQCELHATVQRLTSRKLSLAAGQTAVVELDLLRPRTPGGTMFDADVAKGDGGTAVIGEVPPDSSAARAGFRPGDLILSVDGVSAAGLDPITVDALIADRAAGDLAVVTVRRGGSTLTLSVAIVPER